MQTMRMDGPLPVVVRCERVKAAVAASVVAMHARALSLSPEASQWWAKQGGALVESAARIVEDDAPRAGPHLGRVGQLACAEIGDLPQQRPGISLPITHRLHQRLLARGQPVDARREPGLDRRGQDDAVQLGREPVLPASPVEAAVVGERLDDLLDENGLPLRPGAGAGAGAR